MAWPNGKGCACGSLWKAASQQQIMPSLDLQVACADIIPGSGAVGARIERSAWTTAGVRAGPKAGKSSFQAAHMDFSMGPRPQDSFHPSVDNSNEPFRPQLQPWQASLPGCFAADNEGPPGLHPLQRKVAGLQYQSWKLEASEPVMPQARHPPHSHVKLAYGR